MLLQCMYPSYLAIAGAILPLEANIAFIRHKLATTWLISAFICVAAMPIQRPKFTLQGSYPSSGPRLSRSGLVVEACRLRRGLWAAFDSASVTIAFACELPCSCG